MTIAERLREYWKASGREQKEVAISFGERLKTTGKADRKLETVMSQVSRCLNGDITGVRFCFEDRERGSFFLDELGVPAAARADLMAQAERFIHRDGEIPARLAVDATTLAETGSESRFFLAIEGLASDSPLAPAVVVVRDAQYGNLPLRLLEQRDRLRFERVPNGDAGRKRIEELARDGALVASQWPFRPIEQWLTFHTDGEKLLFSPVDGIAVFAGLGKLPAPGPVEHDLALLIGNEQLPDAKIPDDPRKVRELMLALSDEGNTVTLRLKPHERLAMATALGVTATSTERERIEADLARFLRSVDCAERAGT